VLGDRTEQEELARGSQLVQELSDPEGIPDRMQQQIQSLQAQGQDTSQLESAFQQYTDNPEGFLKGAEMEFARVSTPQQWEAYQATKGKGKAGFKQQELDIKREKIDMRKLENETRRDEQLLMRETNGLKRDELKLKIEERRKKIDQKKVDIGQKAVEKMTATNDTIQSIDDFMANDQFIEDMSGYSGQLPTVFTSGVDAESAFNNIKNNLTLENLGKMSGVLSETDIKILSNAASRLEPGMSEAAMKTELRRIKTVLGRRKKKFEGDAGRAGISLEAKQEQPQPPQQDLSAMSIEELMQLRQQAQ